MRVEEIFVFEACDLPRGPTCQGRVTVKLTRVGERISRAEVVAKGLDNGCHQMDFIDDRLHVVDTYQQWIVRFDEEMRGGEMVYPLPRKTERVWGPANPEYGHVNSLLAVGESRLLLHNGAEQTGRPSEIVVCDREWKQVARRAVSGLGCHGLALLEDGTLLVCGSVAGELISVAGMRVPVSPYYTRGLAVGWGSVVVGASRLSDREGRLRNSGTVTFMDRNYAVRAVLEVPGAPTEIRRLDGMDGSLSGYLRSVPWGSTLPKGLRI